MSENKSPIKFDVEPIGKKDSAAIIKFFERSETSIVKRLVTHKVVNLEMVALNRGIEGLKLSNDGIEKAAVIQLQEAEKYRNFLEVLEELASKPESFGITRLDIHL